MKNDATKARHHLHHKTNIADEDEDQDEEEDDWRIYEKKRKKIMYHGRVKPSNSAPGRKENV